MYFSLMLQMYKESTNKYINRPYLERVASLSVYHCFLGGPSDLSLDLFGIVLDARGRPECPEKNLQVWTEHQMHKSAETGNRTWNSLVQSEGKYPVLAYFPQNTRIASKID